MKKYGLLLLFWGIASMLKANGGEIPRIINFAKSQYQAQNQSWMISQAPNGNMFFANTAGTVQFDGSRWTTHYLPQKQINRSVACDQKGRIFVGGFAEFGYWEENPSGVLIYHSLLKEVKNDRADREEIWNILLGDGWVLFQSFSTLYRYDYHQVVQLSPPGNIMFAQQVHGKVIVPVINQGLYEWSNETGFHFIAGSEFLADKKVKAILEKPGGFLVATERAGIFAYDGNRFTPWINEADQAFGAYQLNRGIRLQNGWIALGTILNGIYLLDENGRLIHHINKENGLQNNTVLSLWEDQAGDLWSGLDKGIDLIALSDPLNYFIDENGKTGSVYTAAIFKNQLYIGTNQGIYRKPFSENLPFQLVPGSQGQAWQLIELDGRLYCGHNNGTYEVREDSVRFISQITGGWHTIRDPERPDLLVQGTYTGVISFEKDHDGDWKLHSRIQELVAPIKKICFDREGYLWAINSYKGIYRMQLDADLNSLSTLKVFGPDEGLPSIFNPEITKMDDRLIVRVDTIFMEWDATTDRFRQLYEYQGQVLHADHLKILKGAEQDWFLVKKNRVEWFTGPRKRGEFPLELVPGFEAVIAIDSLHYLFCLDNGYALINRKAANLSDNYPAPVISQLVIPGGPSFALDQRTDTSGVLQLASGKRYLRFRFSVPFFTEPLLFKYQLEGFSSNWSDWSAISEREFTNLPAGDYIFRVRSNLSGQTSSFSFTILPYWYETKWAASLYLLLFAGLLLLLFRLHRYRLRRQQQRMEIEKQRQLQQERIRVKNRQLQLDVINKSKELANSTFNLVRKNEILLQIKEELNKIKAEAGGKFPDAYQRRLNRLINQHLINESDWQVFETNFNEVHDEFFKKLKKDYPDLTPGDLRLAAYLKMNLSSKEIAPLLNISLRGVENKRYRLRKKMDLPADTNLTSFLLEY